MTTVSARKAHRGALNVGFFVAALAATSLVAIPVAYASGGSTPVLKSVMVKGYAGALATGSSRSLYLLTSEKGAHLKCTGACLTTWLPLLVKDSVTRITLESDVKGKIGFVARGTPMKQVTYNSFPIYTYAGETRSRQHKGEGLAFNAGTWYLVKADAATPAATAFTTTSTVNKPSPTTTTTKPAPTTTTTKPPPTTTTTKPAPTTTTTKPAPTTTTTKPAPTTTTTRPAPTTTTTAGGGIAY